jgi:hypothetical protein
VRIEIGRIELRAAPAAPRPAPAAAGAPSRLEAFLAARRGGAP